jgi:hypothetical protein
MPPLPKPFLRGIHLVGGVLSYPSEQLYEEVACVAFHFHWSLEDILELEHSERQRWITEIGKIQHKFPG